MIRIRPRSILMKYIFFANENLTHYRSVRNIARRGTGPKFIEGKVKTVTKFDDYTRLTSISDVVEDMKKSKLGDALDVEKALLEEHDFGGAVEKCEQLFDVHEREEKHHKSKVKKLIIGRKYFKIDKETNLLTHAAKEQIRFLHKSNPVEWNCKTISECFPISEAGVKKLLKSNFVQTCPEKIKAHDEDVAKKWEILRLGKFTTLISPKTQQLYKEGKLVDDYFSGNPNLPTTLPVNKVVQVEKKKKVGEFSAIVKTYVAYQKNKLLESNKENCSEIQVSLIQNSNLKSSDKIALKNFRKFKHAYEELDDDDKSEIFAPSRKHTADDTDLPLSQFKEILKDESKFMSKNKNNYLNREILKAASKEQIITHDNLNSKMPCDVQDCFIKVPKHSKTKINHVKHEEGNHLNVYKYDEKLGYQHPLGKVIQGNIYISPKLQKKGKLYQVGQCVYDDKGEFLYKLPS